jgi:hypothetical protein
MGKPKLTVNEEKIAPWSVRQTSSNGYCLRLYGLAREACFEHAGENSFYCPMENPGGEIPGMTGS